MLPQLDVSVHHWCCQGPSWCPSVSSGQWPVAWHRLQPVKIPKHRPTGGENLTGVVFNTISLIIFSPSESGDAAEIGAENKTGGPAWPMGTWNHDNLDSLTTLTFWWLRLSRSQKTYVAYHFSFEKGKMREYVIEGLVSRFMLPVSHGSIVFKNS